MVALVDEREIKRKTDASCAFIKKIVNDSGANGVVVGVSGGVDSAAVAALCSRALGKDKVLALIMPATGSSKEQDMQDAEKISSLFAGDTRRFEIGAVETAFAAAIPDYSDAQIPNGNLLARIRMCCLYYYANLRGLLVAGTSDKSELVLGYFTKYGDGACDFEPIAGMYKCEVREVARFLGVPGEVAYKKSSPSLWQGHGAEDELGMSYDEIDSALKALEPFENCELNEDARKRGVSADSGVVAKILKMNLASRHKRKMPESAP